MDLSSYFSLVPGIFKSRLSIHQDKRTGFLNEHLCKITGLPACHAAQDTGAGGQRTAPKDIGGGNGLEDAVLVPNFYTAQQRAAKEAILYPSLYAKDIFLQEATRNAGQLGIKRIILGTVVPVGQLEALCREALFLVSLQIFEL